MYDVILADPPWAYRNLRTGGSHTSGSAQQYPTMSLLEICEMPVRSVMAPDSVCFLWATTPLGVDPYAVLDAWGYTFKTKWYWHKTERKGIGYWTRGEVEEVLIGVRGNVKAWRSPLSNYIEGEFTKESGIVDVGGGFPLVPRLRQDFDVMMAEQEGEVLHTKPAGHSKKPEEVQERIEILTPGARCVELFATRTRAGWDTFGLALDPAHDFRSKDFWDGLRRTAAERSRPSVPAEV